MGLREHIGDLGVLDCIFSALYRCLWLRVAIEPADNHFRIGFRLRELRF